MRELLSKHFAIAGIALDVLSTEQFRARMTENIKQFSTRKEFDRAVWIELVNRLYYTPGDFSDPEAYRRLADLVAKLETKYQTGGNIVIYLATPPSVFGLISTNLERAGFKKRDRGWIRIIVEKPFGNDLPSAVALNKELLAYWKEEQIYRIDHYLGKETVQNLLAFRFSNGIFEPLWNKNHIDHIQFSVSETVGVEGRGQVLRSHRGRAGHDPKPHVANAGLSVHGAAHLVFGRRDPQREIQVLSAVRVWKPEEVPLNAVRGQYGPGRNVDGTAAAGYRQEPDVDPESSTETFAALRPLIDTWRLGGRTDLSPLRQTPLEARHGDHRSIQEGPGGHLSGYAGHQPGGGQPPHFSHAARSRH